MGSDEKKYPFYLGGDVNKFLREVDEYRFESNKELYGIILEFVNKIKLTAVPVKSLLDIKNVKKERLDKNKEKKKKILKKYIPVFIEKFRIKIGITQETPDDKIQVTYIIYLLRRLLKKIDYRLKTTKDTLTITNVK